MDFSGMNQSEQAAMARYVEKKQVSSVADPCLSARLRLAIAARGDARRIRLMCL
jgi:hypothetical protein